MKKMSILLAVMLLLTGCTLREADTDKTVQGDAQEETIHTESAAAETAGTMTMPCFGMPDT